MAKRSYQDSQPGSSGPGPMGSSAVLRVAMIAGPFWWSLRGFTGPDVPSDPDIHILPLTCDKWPLTWHNGSWWSGLGGLFLLAAGLSGQPRRAGQVAGQPQTPLSGSVTVALPGLAGQLGHARELAVCNTTWRTGAGCRPSAWPCPA